MGHDYTWNMKLSAKGDATYMSRYENVIRIVDENKLILPDVFLKLLIEDDYEEKYINKKLYDIDEIVERNETWEVNIYAPGYIAIGDDGGGNVFLMKAEKSAYEVVMVDGGYMNPLDNPKIITYDFDKWISQGANVDDESQKEDYVFCDIIISKMPSNGLKGLLEIKKILGISMSISEILNAAKNPPGIIAKQYSYPKAVSRLGKMKSEVDFFVIRGIE